MCSSSSRKRGNVTRYEVRAERMEVLSVLAAHGESEFHGPKSYVAYVDMSLLGRWASVECRCGNQNREWWLPETETYLDLLIVAWSQLECSKYEYDPSVRRVDIVELHGSAPPEVFRDGSYMRVSLPQGWDFDESARFIAANCTIEERNRIREHLGMPLMEDDPHPTIESINVKKVRSDRGST